MGNESTGADRGAPDLAEQIDLAVGRLTVVAAEIRSGGGENGAQAEAIERAMLLLAGLQGVVAWEPGAYRFTPEAIADQLRAMATVGPRPQAVVKLLDEAAGHIDTAAAARAEAAEPVDPAEVSVRLRAAERRAYDLAEDAIALGRRLASMQVSEGRS